MRQQTSRLPILHELRPAGFRHLFVNRDRVRFQDLPAAETEFLRTVELILRRSETHQVDIPVARRAAHCVKVLAVVHVLVVRGEPALRVVHDVGPPNDVTVELVDVSRIVVLCHVEHVHSYRCFIL